MDHHTAVRAQAPERYVLGELPLDVREDFEAHLFNCIECADEVKTATMFAANARAVFTEKNKSAPVPRRWLEWFGLRPTPAFAMSAALNAILLLGAGYELVVLRPALHAQFDPQTPQLVALRGVLRASGQEILVNKRILLFEVEPPRLFQRYSYEISGEGGMIVRSGPVDPPEGSVVQVAVPVLGLDPGDYRFKLRGTESGRSEAIGESLFRIPGR